MERMNFKALPLRIEGFDWAAAAMGYGTYERRMIFSLKYDGNTYVAVTAAELIRDAIVHMTIDDISCPLLRADHHNRSADKLTACKRKGLQPG